MSATPRLVFGFSANEKNNSAEITISRLERAFEEQHESLAGFSAGDNQIVIRDFHSGSSHTAVQLQIDLDFEIIRNGVTPLQKTGPIRLIW